jgi:hypothetical protein
VGINAWERWGAKATVWHREEEGITIGRQGGINTLRSRSATATFEIPEPPGKIVEPLRTGDFSRLTWVQPGTSGKKLRGSGKDVFKAKAAS